MENPEWMDDWCNKSAGLQKMPDNTWSSVDQSEVSFPTHMQSDLARIEDSSYWFAHRNNIIADVVDLFPPAGPIVDVGGGNGFVSRGLIQRGYDAMVIEPGPLGNKTCADRGVPSIRAAFQDIVAPENGTAAIGIFDVLEHIEDDVSALQGIRQTLTLDGMLYIAVPAYNFLWSKEDIDGGHFRRYTLAGLGAKLRSSGFTVEFGTYFFASMVLPMFALRTLPSLVGRRDTVNAAQTASEHSLPKGPIGAWLSRSFVTERRAIRNGKKVSYGTSCLVAARKTR